MLVLDRARAHVIQNGVAEHVVERVCLADVVRRAADDDGQLRLIVEVGDQIAVAENVAAGGDGLVHALGKVDRERVRRLDALAGDGLALLGVVKIIDAQADHVLLRAGDGREQPHALERQHGAAQHGGSVQRRPDADERLHVRTARHGMHGSAGRVEQADGAAAVLFKCHELHNVRAPLKIDIGQWMCTQNDG